MLYIKELQKEDTKEAGRFLLTTMEEAFPHPLSETARLDALYMNERLVQPQRTAVFGAYIDGEAAGTIAVRPYDGRIASIEGRYDLKETCEIIKCYVDPAMRKKGIGTALLRELLHFCRQNDYHMLYLHTQLFLEGGLSFWKKQGFSVIAEENDEWETVHMEGKLAAIEQIVQNTETNAAGN